MSDDVAPPPRRAGRFQIAITSVVIVLVVAWSGVWYWRAHRTGVEFAALFTASVGVYPGSDVRILGVPVGRVDSVVPQGGLVRVSMHLDPGVRAGAGTDAVIISPNLVSDRYVQLTSVYTSGAALGSGTTIPSSRTKTPVELDELYKSLDQLSQALGPNGANSDGALNRLLKTGAANLDGNGVLINKTITQLAAAGSTLAGSSDQIFSTIDNLSQFTQQLQSNNNSLVTLNSQLASVSQVLANDRYSFGAAIQQLGVALGLVQTFVRDNRSALSTNVKNLSTVAGTLATERDSVSQALRSAPLLVQNFINAYDAKNNVLRGRVDLNELTVWAAKAATTAATSSAAIPASTGPAGLLPSTNITNGSG